MYTLERLSLWKLVHVLEHMDLDPCRTEGVVELLHLISELKEMADDIYTLMVHYAASRLRFLVRCPMQKRPELSYSILNSIGESL